jgi:hypothetical protein
MSARGERTEWNRLGQPCESAFYLRKATSLATTGCELSGNTSPSEFLFLYQKNS